MIGGDVVVAFFDRAKNSFHAEDYYLSATMECDGKNGACPDERLGGRNDAVSVTGTRRNGVTCIVYRRPVQTNEAINDQPVPMDAAALVIAAVGPLADADQPGAHAVHDATKGSCPASVSSVNSPVGFFVRDGCAAVRKTRPNLGTRRLISHERRTMADGEYYTLTCWTKFTEPAGVIKENSENSPRFGLRFDCNANTAVTNSVVAPCSKQATSL